MNRASNRRTLTLGLSFGLAAVLNLAILMLIIRFDRPARQKDDVENLTSVIPIDLSGARLPVEVLRPKSFVEPASQSEVAKQTRHAPSTVRQVSPPPALLSATPAASGALPADAPLSPPTGPAQQDAATHAGVLSALRALSACSGSNLAGDPEERERCQSAFARADGGQTIEAVPEGARADYDAASARAARVRDGVMAKLPEAGHGMVRDRGMNIRIHAGCWVKFGAGQTSRVHCGLN